MIRGLKGVFIVLEGPDKSGKSTQAALLAQSLRGRGKEVVHTREPGGTSFAEKIRAILLDRRHRVEPLAELLLYEAARAQHTAEIVLPALRAGKTVISERYTLATLAYQGHARGLALPTVRKLNAVASYGLRPDLTVVLDIPEAAFASRDVKRRLDRLESEPAAFRRKVREGYRRLARREPACILLDGNLPVDVLHRELLLRLKRFFK